MERGEVKGEGSVYMTAAFRVFPWRWAASFPNLVCSQASRCSQPPTPPHPPKPSTLLAFFSSPFRSRCLLDSASPPIPHG